MDKLEVRQKINAICKQYSLSIIDPLDIDDQLAKGLHRLVLKVKSQEGMQIIRLSLDQSSSAKKRLINETNVLKFLKKEGYKFQPEIFGYNVNEMWAIHEYVEGEVAGQLLDFSPLFIESIKSNVIVDLLRTIKSLKPEIIEEDPPLISQYRRQMDFIVRNYPNKNTQFKAWCEIFETKIKNKFSGEFAFSHSDLSAGNIIYTKNTLRLIDWESAKYEPFWKDFASVYYRASKYPEWQNHYTNSLLFSIDQRENFNCYLAYFLANDTAGISQNLNEGKYYYYRSGDMTKKQMKDIIERNVEIFNSISL